MKWYIKVLKQYADFSGRARRKEYWMFTLINAIIIMALQSVIFLAGGMNPDSGLALVLTGILGVYIIGILLPSLAVGIRRLHDTNRSGWWALISFIPIIGAIVLIIFFVQDSQPGTNQYGPNPKEEAEPATV